MSLEKRLERLERECGSNFIPPRTVMVPEDCSKEEEERLVSEAKKKTPGAELIIIVRLV